MKREKEISKMIRKIVKIIGLGFALLISAVLTLLVIGMFIPKLKFVGVMGTLASSFFLTDLWILALLIGGISFLLMKRNKKKIHIAIFVLSAIAVIGFSFAIISLFHEARTQKADISLLDSITSFPSEGKPDMKKSLKYATVDGKDLYVQISEPQNSSEKERTPIIMIHGGGYVSGERNHFPAWTEFFNERGYVVFDVDYRLATDTYHTWDKASADIASAIVWISQNAEKYDVNMDKLLITGASSGGGLALQVAYEISDGTLKAYLPGELSQPKAVIALYPAQELVELWEKGNKEYNTKYIGGSPEEYPKEYEALLPINHITKNTPSTLIVAGESDHLVPYDTQDSLVTALKKAGIHVDEVGLKYSEHSFDLAASSLQSQIARGSVARFLDARGDSSLPR